MQIRQLEIRNFRNYLSQSLIFKTRVNLFLGDNGQGKTNLLEALYLLTRGISFRPVKSETLIHQEVQRPLSLGTGAFLSATIQRDSLESQVKISLSRDSKSYLINGKKSSAQVLGRSFPSILFSPESLGAIKEGPEARRQLIDEALTGLSVDAARTASSYSRCLRAKNRLLRDFKKGLYREASFMETLSSLNASFLPLACRLTQLRILLINDLLPDLQRAIQFIFSPKNVDISVDYSISSQSASGWGSEEIIQAAIALDFGVSDVVVGLTIVAAGTSLPELATSIVAALRGERDLAIGNVVGSNVFNLLGILGLASLTAPSGLSVASQVLGLDAWVALGAAALLLPLARSGGAIVRWEGALLVVAYAAYLATVVAIALGRFDVPPVGVGAAIAGLPLLAAVGAITRLPRRRLPR